MTHVSKDLQHGLEGAIDRIAGLTNAGESLPHAIQERLHQIAYRTCVLDGDNVCHRLNLQKYLHYENN